METHNCIECGHEVRVARIRQGGETPTGMYLSRWGFDLQRHHVIGCVCTNCAETLGAQGILALRHGGKRRVAEALQNKEEYAFKHPEHYFRCGCGDDERA